MDNLTHSLVGVLLARAGLVRGASRPLLLSVVAANAPDIDIFVGFEPADYLVYHRHLTHALIAIPFMALFSAALVLGGGALWRRLRGRQAPPKQASFWRDSAAALLPVATHPLLDLTNSYGVRLWLPFSGEWASWDLLFIVDLTVWLILLLAVGIPALLKLVDREVGAGEGRGTAGAWAGLAALMLYVGLQAVAQEQAVEALDARLYGGAEPRHAAAFPRPLNPLSRLGYVRTNPAEYLLPLRVDQLDEVDPDRADRLPQAPPGPAVAAAWETELGRAYRQFARYPIVRVEELEHGWRVTFSDVRFLRGLGQLGFACRIRLDRQLREVESSFAF